MRIGYARVSTRDQKLELQLDALRKADCEWVFTGTMSGPRRTRYKILCYAGGQPNEEPASSKPV